MIVNLIMVCQLLLEPKCERPKIEQLKIAEEYLEHVLPGEDIEFRKVRALIGTKDTKFTYKDLINYSNTFRSIIGLPEDELIGFLGLSDAEFAGLADYFSGSGGFYVTDVKTTKVDDVFTRILIHEILHMYGYSHVKGDDNIMNPKLICPNMKVTELKDKCKLNKEHRFDNH